MTPIDGLHVFITGASSGIGEAIARELAGGGAKVTLAARREDRLATLKGELEKAGGVAHVVALDVTRRGDVAAAVKSAEQQHGPIDVMINNAGVMLLSTLNKTKVEEWDQMIDVNVKGLLYGTAAVLPAMLTRGRGHIVNVASVAGHVVFPGAAVYCGTKFAVRAITEGLRQEVGDKVRCTIISPGAVATELPDHITDDEVKQNMEPVLNMAIDPAAIARAVRFAIEQPADVDVNEVLVRPTAQPL